MNATDIAAIPTTALHHATRTKATKLAQLIEAEYPRIVMDPSWNEDQSRVTGWAFFAEANDTDEGFDLHTVKLPELADVLEAAAEAECDPTATEDEAEEAQSSGNVVKDEYRLRYAEVSSNGQTCGDWLAERLTEACTSKAGFSVQDFQAILDMNGVDQSGAWARLPESGQKGWVGRWRMNGRQILEKVVALSGGLMTPAGALVVPDADLAILRTKHAKYIAKQLELARALGELRVNATPEPTEAA